MSYNTQNRIFDGGGRNTGQKTVHTGFRIYQKQHDILKNTYSGNSSALIRILLDKYINGELPQIEDEFKQLIKI